jgi:signal transduction histidine kinase
MNKANIKIILMGVTLVILGGLTYYFHQVRHSGTVFTHLFYIPIIVSAYWWKKRGIVVALLLSVLIILSGFFLKDYSPNTEDVVRAIMFVIVGLVAVIATERIEKIYEKLNQTEIALEHSEKIAGLGQLAAGVSHEINNPLGIILMYAHMLRDEMSDADAGREELDTIIEQADRCKTIVADLLRFSRSYSLTFQPVDLSSLVLDVTEKIRRASGVTVIIEPVEDVITVNADEEQLKQAVENIVLNALEAMNFSGTVRLEIDDASEDARIIVQDEGIGISPDSLDRIFEPFYTTKRSGTGAGLGLAVSYGIVKMHGGDIAVDSNADPQNGPTGTCVTIILPKYSNKTKGMKT